MRCPECETETEVVDSRVMGETRRRRRQCREGHRFTTLETVVVGVVEEEAAEVRLPAVVQPWAERILRSLDCVGGEGGKSAGEVAV